MGSVCAFALVSTGAAWCAGSPKVPAEEHAAFAGKTATVGWQSSDVSLEESVDTFRDFMGRGTVHVLDNGTIMVYTGGNLVTDERGQVTAVTMEEAVLLKVAGKEIDREERDVVLGFEDQEIELLWDGDDAATGTLVVYDAGGNVVLNVSAELTELNASSTSSCSANCDGGLSCTQSCPVEKAGDSYCNKKTPVCKCVKKADVE